MAEIRGKELVDFLKADLEILGLSLATREMVERKMKTTRDRLLSIPGGMWLYVSDNEARELGLEEMWGKP